MSSRPPSGLGIASRTRPTSILDHGYASTLLLRISLTHILLVKVEQLFQASAVQLQTLSELRINLMFALQSAPTNQIGARSIDILTRHVRLFGKLFRRMQELSHPKFVALPLCGDLVLYYWSKVVQASSAPAEAIAGTDKLLRFYYV